MQSLAIFRALAQSNKKSNAINLHYCRFCSSEPSVKQRPPSMFWTIFGSNSAYNSVNATLDFSRSKVVFNCGEGIQRIVNDNNGRGLGSLELICITRMDWKCVGGLSDVLLGYNRQMLNVLGPSKLNVLCNRIMRNIPKAEFHINVVACDNRHTWIDNKSHALVIHAIPLKNASEKTAKVIAYVGSVKEHHTKINIEKCIDLNVPAGPMITQLAKGFDVTLDDGTVVRATDVCDYFPQLNFLVVDIPTVDYLHHLEKSELVLDGIGTDATVLHFSPPTIIATEEYQNYMRKFPARTLHMKSKGNSAFSGHISPHKNQTLLNHINGQVFPMLREQIKCTNEPISNECTASGMRIENLISNRTISCRPDKFIEDKLKLEPTEWMESFINSADKVLAIENFQNLYNEHIVKHPIAERAREYPKIVFLGTAATMPSRNRNVSSILLHVSKDSSVLLDCGEGTLGQLYRFYGDQAHEVLSNLKAIFISHMHLDHFMGLFNLLRQVKEIHSMNSNLAPLELIGPIALQRRLNLFNSAIQDVNGIYNFINSDQLRNQQNRKEQIDQLMTKIGLSNIETCAVQHTEKSFGISMSVHRPHENSTFKLTYSGDTRPCKDLVALGKDSTVLIHEATLDDDLADMADLKMHSTVSQAVTQGIRMNAKYTILTHFSHRSRIPRLIRTLPHNVTCAIDNMELVESDLTLSHHLYNVLRSVYQEQMDEYETAAVRKKHWKKNPRNSVNRQYI